MVRSMHIGFNVTPYGLTPTQERTLRALLSARLHRAQSGTIVLPINAQLALQLNAPLATKSPAIADGAQF